MFRYAAVLCVSVVVFVPGRVSAQTFSVDGTSPTVQDPAYAFLPSDLFSPSGGVGPTPALQINGSLYNNQFPIEVNGISMGRPVNQFTQSPNQVYFSLDRGSSGQAGTASSVEFNFGAGGSEQSSDVFVSSRNNSNALAYDGDGLATSPNGAAPALGVAEAATYTPPPGVPVAGGDLDAFDLRNTFSQPPSTNMYFTVNTSTITQGTYGGVGSAADIFISPVLSGYDAMPPAQLYATEAQLGFPVQASGNEIDALVIFDDGDGVYTPGTDIVAFSLAASASAYLGQTDPVTGLTISPGDILVDGATAQSLLGAATAVPSILFTAESLGLRTARGGYGGDDNLNALDFLPEPSTGLLSAGLGALALIRRTRRRRF